MHMESKSSFIVIAVLIGGIVVGFVLGAGIAQSRASAQLQKMQAQIDRAKKFFPVFPQETRTLSGTVKEVNAGGHIVTVEVPAIGPFDESPVMRKAMIGPDTKITRAEPKDQATFQRELADFQKAVRAQSGKPGFHPLAPPDPFREIAGIIADLRPGARITVTADENIRDKEEFTATAIRIFDVSASKGPFGALVPEPSGSQ